MRRETAAQCRINRFVVKTKLVNDLICEHGARSVSSRDLRRIQLWASEPPYPISPRARAAPIARWVAEWAERGARVNRVALGPWAAFRRTSDVQRSTRECMLRVESSDLVRSKDDHLQRSLDVPRPVPRELTAAAPNKRFPSFGKAGARGTSVTRPQFVGRATGAANSLHFAIGRRL